MSPVGDKTDLPLVQTERQARELAKIKDPVKRKKVWEKANRVAAAIGTAVTAKLVKEATKREESVHDIFE